MSTSAITLPSDADASGRSFGEEELALLRRVLESGTLNCTRGTVVREFEGEFADYLGLPFCRCASSGTAALHAATAAFDPEPGDEIVTTPITDMGAIAAILFQAAVPVFADVDPLTYNVTAETLAAKITPRTRALVVTHLFGNPCDMGPIMELAGEHGLPVIEDCAQAYGARYRGRYAGTFGDVACFSLQQGKHITAGEGGMVLARDEKLARRINLFIDKAWGYGDPQPDHYFLAPNYRMTELQGAVALAQLRKLQGMVARRIAMADRLSDKLAAVPGVSAPKITPEAVHSYWRYALRVDAGVVEGGAVGLGRALQASGVACGPRYIQKPAFECEVLRDRRTFGDSAFPYRCTQRDGAPEVVYDRADTPGAVAALEGVVVLGWSERYEEKHVDFIAEVIGDAAARLARGAA